MSHRRTANEAIVDIFMAATDAEAEALLSTAKAIMRQRRPKVAKRAPRKPVEVVKQGGTSTPAVVEVGSEKVRP